MSNVVLSNTLGEVKPANLPDAPIFEQKQTKIFILEENDDLRTILSYTLRNKGYKILSFDNAYSLFDRMEKESADIVLADHPFRKLNALEFCNKIKRNYPSVFIIFLCYEDFSCTEHYKLIGADEIIVKPFDYSTFVEKFDYIHQIIYLQKCYRHVYDELKSLKEDDNQLNIKNKKSFENLSRYEVEKTNRYNKSLSLLLIELDSMENFSFQFGDTIEKSLLKHVGILLSESSRKTDILYPLDKRTFVLLLPETTYDKALLVAKKFEKTLQEKTYTFKNTKMPVNASIGIASREFDSTVELNSLINKAKESLIF